MKVLHIITDLGQGGAQRYVFDLVGRQIEQNINVHIIALFSKGALWPSAEKLGIPMECHHIHGALDFIGLWHLFKWLRRRHYDIVHVHAIHPLVSWMVGKLKSKNIYTEHAGDLLGGDWKATLVYRFFHKSYCRFVAISQEMAEVMGRFGNKIKQKTIVVYNGVDLDWIDSLPKRRKGELPKIFWDANYRVGFIGRLVPLKGLDTFLQVASHIIKMEKKVVFPIVGDGDLRNQLEESANKLGLQNNVIFFGYRIDAIEILKHFDVLLFTSEYEGFGLVVIEAMAAGVPVVAVHKRGAIKEIIENTVTGIVVENERPIILAKMVLELLKDSELKHNLRIRARKKVEECFSIAKNAEEIFQLYKECMCEMVK